VILRSTTKSPVDYKVAIHSVREGVYDATLTCENSTTSYSAVRASMTSVNSLRMEINSGLSMFSIVPEKASVKSSTSQMNMDRIHIFYHGYRTTLLLPRPRWLAELTEETAAALGGAIKAPMPSLVVDVRAVVGSSIEKGQVVVVLESMKTEIVLRASQSGVVKAVNCKQGDMVAEGVELVLIDEH
jgi:3-methylcrotonyl-CoA carboxylase alpha subunit